MTTHRRLKKGDHVRMVADDAQGSGYRKGTTGTIADFRTNRFYGRQAIVELDDQPGLYVDWTLTDIETVP